MVQKNAKKAYTYAAARCSSVASTSTESRMVLEHKISRRHFYARLAHLRKKGEA